MITSFIFQIASQLRQVYVIYVNTRLDLVTASKAVHPLVISPITSRFSLFDIQFTFTLDQSIYTDHVTTHTTPCPARFPQTVSPSRKRTS